MYWSASERKEILNGDAFKKAGFYIPTLYFIEGLPYALVATVSVVMLQNLGATREYIGQVTSLLTLPWTLKFIWAPLIDVYGLKRNWIVISHLILSVVALAVALALGNSVGLSLCIAALACMAIASATQDVAMDGFYLEVLDKKNQSIFVGIRNAAYRMALLFGQGVLVYLAGTLSHSLGVRGGWEIVFIFAALKFALAAVLHWYVLPRPQAASITAPGKGEFLSAFTSFFKRPRIVPIMLYMLLFRLGDALMLKMAQPFLLDDRARGGLAISTENVGIIYGGVGLGFLLAGGIAGSYIVSRFGLKKTLMPTALVQNSAILLYFAMSAMPEPSLVTVCVFNAYEQLAYGVGLATYTVFLLGLASERYRSGHYAIATAFMALGVLIAGYFSGTLCEMLGYKSFFLACFLLSLPGMITIFFLPVADTAGAGTKQ